jgi:protein TonB
MSAILSPASRLGTRADASPQITRAIALIAIVLAHGAALYALQARPPKQVAHVAPREVIATFVVPEATPAQPQPQVPTPPQPAPKTPPAVKKPVTPPRPKAPPPVLREPSPRAIAAPPAEPAPPEPATPVAPTPPVAAAQPTQPGPATPSAPVASAAPAQPKTISSGIEYVQAPQPVYPPASRRMGEEGLTVLRVLVNENGRPERVEVHKPSSSARLDEAARQAVQRAVFKPFMENGRAVPAYAIVPIRFQLNN